MGIKKPFFKVAFIGAGRMGEEHVKIFSKFKKKFLLSGILSKKNFSARKLAKKYKIKNVCNSINDLYLKTKADLVVISVPVLETKKVCIQSFKYPWKFLIEKPVGYNLNEAKTIFKLAEKKKQLNNILVGLNRRNYLTTLKVLEELKNNYSKRFVQIYDQQDLKNILVKKQPTLVKKNWMFANSIHLIDYFNILCRGKIVKIKNFHKIIKKKTNIITSQIEFSSGDIGQYNCIWSMPGPWAVNITSQSIRYEMKPLEILKFQKRGTTQLANFNLDYKKDLGCKPGLANQVEQIYLFLSKKKNNLPKLKDSYETMKLINRIYR